MKNRAFLLAIFSALLIGAASFKLVRAGVVRGQNLYQTQPFSTSAVSFRIQDNHEITMETIETHVKADGTRAEIRNAVPLNPWHDVVLLKTLDGKTIAYSKDAHTKSTTRRKPGGLRLNSSATRSGPDPSSCTYPMERLIRTEQRFGETVQIVEYIHTGDALARDVDARMPQYDCEIVEHLEQYKKDPKAEWNTRVGTRVVSFQKGDPAASLFTGFEKFPELSPTEFRRATFLAHGLKPHDCPKCFAENPAADARYFQEQ